MRGAVELARAAAGSGDPIQAMRAIVALREELKGLEASHVATALADGRSWSQIAEALGVSKQAAHRRHAGRVREAPPPPRPAPQRRLLVTGQARRVVDRARAEAETAGSEEVAPEHLLVGLLGDDHGTAVRALQSAGLELDAARAALPRGAGNRPLGRIPVSRTTRATLEDSLREAVRLGDSHLGVEHLLLALLRDPNGPASRLIARLGVEPEQVTRRVHELVGSG